MTQTTTDQSTAPPPKKPGRKPRERVKIPGEASFVAAMPTRGEDLVAMWDLPPAAWQEGRLKISRKQYASHAQELVDTTSVEDYDLEAFVKHMGPGDYYLLLSPHPTRLWAQHNCKVSVSADYARRAGFQAYPARPEPVEVPRLSQVAAMTTAAQALSTDAPLTAGNLMLIMEQVIERTIKAVQPAPTPGAGMGFDQAMLFYSTMDRMRESAEEKAEARMLALMNRDTPRESEHEGGDSFADMVRQAIPVFMTMLKPAPAQPAVSTLSDSEPEHQEEPMQVNVPLTSNERAKFTLAVAMLKPFVPQILASMAKNPDDQAIASELADFVPGPLRRQLIELADLTEARGCEVLGMLSPDLQTPRGAAIIKAISTRLSTQA